METNYYSKTNDTAIESVSHRTNLQLNIQILLIFFTTSLPDTSSTFERTLSTLNRT